MRLGGGASSLVESHCNGFSNLSGVYGKSIYINYFFFHTGDLELEELGGSRNMVWEWWAIDDALLCTEADQNFPFWFFFFVLISKS